MFSKPTAVNFFNQFVRSFVTPYQQSQPPPQVPVILHYLKPFSCEWLSRPGIALSEYAEAISSNMAILNELKKSKISNKKMLRKLQTKFNPLNDQLNHLNRKNNLSRTSDDAKAVLSFIADNDEEFDATIDHLFQASNAMFCIAANHVVARSLLRNPRAYSGIIEVSNEIGQEFNRKGDPKAMKRYLLQDFSTERNDTPTIDILIELDSMTEDSPSESTTVSESSSGLPTLSRKRKVIQETSKFSSLAKRKKVRMSAQKTPTVDRQLAKDETPTSANQRSERKNEEEENSLPLVKAAKSKKKKSKKHKRTKPHQSPLKYQVVSRKSKTHIKELR